LQRAASNFAQDVSQGPSVKIAGDHFLTHCKYAEKQKEKHGLFDNVGKQDTGAAPSLADLERVQNQNELSENEGLHGRDAKRRELDSVTVKDRRLVEQECAIPDEQIGRDHQVFKKFVLKPMQDSS